MTREKSRDEAQRRGDSKNLKRTLVYGKKK